MTDEPHDVPTDDEVRAAFAAFLKSRADKGVLLTKSADVTFEDGVVSVIFYPAAAIPDPALLMELSPFKNHAQLAGVPIMFDNDEGRWLRRAVMRVDTFLASGDPIGSMTTAELYEHGTGMELPATE